MSAWGNPLAAEICYNPTVPDDPPSSISSQWPASVTALTEEDMMKARSISFAIALVVICPYLSAQWIPTNGPYVAQMSSFIVSGADLVVGTDVGVFHSTNAGANWSAASSGLTNTTIYSLAISGTNLFVGTPGGVVFFSPDNYASWYPASNGLTNTNVYALPFSGTNLFAGIDFGVFLSINSGTSWTKVNRGVKGTTVRKLAVSGTNLFAGTDFGGFLSTNGGTVWSLINHGLTGYDGLSETATSVRALAVSGTNLFAGTDCGDFLSTNNGANWT